MNSDNKKDDIKKEENSEIQRKNSIFALFGIKKDDYDKLKQEKKMNLPIKAPIITKEEKKHTEIEDEEQEENYIKINTKNQFEIYNSIESSKKLNEIIKYVDELLEEKANSESISQIFLDKLFPKCLNKAFSISKVISRRLMKTKKINKKIIEEKLKCFFDKRIEIRYSKKLILDKETINNIGYILCYSYSKFEEFRIFEKKDLNNYAKMSRKTDTINEFYGYCNQTGRSPIDNNLLEFLESKNSNYLLPGEFIFLINIFDCINILEIDMNIEIDKTKEEHDDDFYLFIITQLNIHYLAILTNHFKINFNNVQLQKDIYAYFTDELTSVCKSGNSHLKKNKEMLDNELYKKRWDFEKYYIFNYKKRQFVNKEESSIISNNNQKDNTAINNNLRNSNRNNNNLNEDINISFVDVNKDNDFLYSKTIPKMNRSGILLFNQSGTSHKNLRSYTEAEPEIDSIQFDKNPNAIRAFSLVEKNDKKKILDKYDIIIDNNRSILELIHIVCLGILRLKNLKNLDLIMNDCYYKEFITLFEQYYCSSKSSSNIDNFHLLNNFIKKMEKLEIFNIEFNSLDYLSFYKLLSILKRNENLNCLQISFFSSLISYSPQFIYKLYQQYSKKEINSHDIYNLESFLLHELFPYFIENIEVLFELIKSKMEKFEILSFNFDVPDIVAVKQRYLVGILKFIINILLLADNKKAKIKKLIILSPRTILDSRSMLNIEQIFDTINFNKKNKTVKELSIQMQFYKIHNINNFISHNLITLKLGEMDITTLQGLTRHLCSYKFFKNSSLKHLTIGILTSITNFSKEIEYLLNEILSIKIKTLKEIHIYSNLFIKEEKSLYHILRNNWISSVILTLNEKSKLSWKQKEIEAKINQIMEDNNKNKNKNNDKIVDKKILYLLHHELEDEILTRNELVIRNKKKLKNIDLDCETAWYIRYMLIFIYSKKKKYKINYYDIKNIIFNILKYLYFTKTAKIENEINLDS